MYVCVCKAVTDSQLAAAINSGLCSRQQLFQCFGVGGDCGKCNRAIAQMLTEKPVKRCLPAANDSNSIIITQSQENNYARR